MKLICCVRCSEVFSLSEAEEKECSGGHGGGKYMPDHLAARIWGPKSLIFVLGVSNSSLTKALGDQLRSGDSLEMMPYSGGPTPKGRDFTSFVIPYAARSIVWFETKAEAYGVPPDKEK